MLYQYVTENFPTKRADLPRRNANAAWPGKVGGAAKAEDKHQVTLIIAAPSIPQGGARWMLS